MSRFQSIFYYSTNWKNWISIIDERTCIICRENHGKVFLIDTVLQISPPVHPNCRCKVSAMKALKAGNATKDGLQGADYYVKMYNRLPENYITIDEAKKAGWNNKSRGLDIIARGKQLSKGRFYNRERKLPDAYGRIWNEADINYSGGFRNSMRIVYSNDGLIFVTYDHYQTFIEIV